VLERENFRTPHRTEVDVRGGSVRERKVVVEKDADASRSELWRADERQAYKIKRSRVRLRVSDVIFVTS
jgi:hypothetical protein